MARWFVLGCVLCVACLLVGCGKARPVAVKGTIELDGKPMPDGSITLIAEDGSPPDVLPVKNGTFEGYSVPGKKRVEIRAFKMGKATKMGTETIPASPENFLPARFTSESKITAEVKSSGLDPSSFTVLSN